MEAALATGWVPEAVVMADTLPPLRVDGVSLAGPEEIRRRMAQPRLDPVVAIGPLPDRLAGRAAGADTLVVLGVQDPGNMGAIIRSARGLGVGGAVLMAGAPDPFNPRVVRASAGAVLGWPVARAGEVDPGDGRALLVAEAHGGGQIPSPPPGRWALVLGHETRGLPHDWERGVPVTLPVAVESLGVAAAAAVLMDRLLEADSAPV